MIRRATLGEMENEAKETSHAAAWISCVVITIIAYPLSIGPVAWFLIHVMKCVSPPRMFILVYSPLIWLTEHNQAFKHFMEWYGSLWHL